MTAAELLNKYHAKGYTLTLINRGENIMVSPELTSRQIAEIKPLKPNLITEIARRIESGGVGTEIKNIIPERFVDDDCGCEDYAKQLDVKGLSWCEHHQPQITKVLAEKAQRLKVGKVSRWANRIAAAAIVRLAIRNAKAKELQP